ncbi:6644_t:CDS:2, partial [Gigaspora margarita]
ETNLGVQELSNNIKEYIQIIDQIAVTEDILMNEGIIEIVMDEFRDNETDDDNSNEEPPSPPITIMEAIEVLEKVIRKGFDKNGLIILWKKLKK